MENGPKPCWVGVGVVCVHACVRVCIGGGGGIQQLNVLLLQSESRNISSVPEYVDKG